MGPAVTNCSLTRSSPTPMASRAWLEVSPPQTTTSRVSPRRARSPASPPIVPPTSAAVTEPALSRASSGPRVVWATTSRPARSADSTATDHDVPVTSPAKAPAGIGTSTQPCRTASAIWPAVVVDADADTTSVGPREAVGAGGLRGAPPRRRASAAMMPPEPTTSAGPAGRGSRSRALATVSICASSTASTTKASVSAASRSCAHRSSKVPSAWAGSCRPGTGRRLASCSPSTSRRSASCIGVDGWRAITGCRSSRYTSPA